MRTKYRDSSLTLRMTFRLGFQRLVFRLGSAVDIPLRGSGGRLLRASLRMGIKAYRFVESHPSHGTTPCEGWGTQAFGRAKNHLYLGGVDAGFDKP